MGTRTARDDDGADLAIRPPAGFQRSRSPLDLRRLLPILGVCEAWAFGFTGLIEWLFAVAGVNAELGSHALLMWIPLAAAGVLVNLQVMRLGLRWPEMSGGTPNYTFRLLRDGQPNLARARIAADAGRVAVGLDTREQGRALAVRDDFITWG